MLCTSTTQVKISVAHQFFFFAIRAHLLGLLAPFSACCSHNFTLDCGTFAKCICNLLHNRHISMYYVTCSWISFEFTLILNPLVFKHPAHRHYYMLCRYPWHPVILIEYNVGRIDPRNIEKSINQSLNQPWEKVTSYALNLKSALDWCMYQSVINEWKSSL